MRFLAICRPAPDVDVAREFMPHARAEMDALWALYSEGVVREMYQPGVPGAVLVLECADSEHARAQLERLPLVANGLVQAEVIELQPFGALRMLFAETRKP